MGVAPKHAQTLIKAGAVFGPDLGGICARVLGNLDGKIARCEADPASN